MLLMSIDRREFIQDACGIGAGIAALRWRRPLHAAPASDKINLAVLSGRGLTPVAAWVFVS